jgi:NAD(P)-dependent dehydrogenase (short-subunit alcohol dehydrogenase family)
MIRHFPPGGIAMLLKDKVVIVTGVGPGMGRKLATIAAEEGARVAIAARSEAFLAEVTDEIKGKGGQVIAVPTDVSEMAQCQRLAKATQDAFGRIDGLVNSAYMPANLKGLEDSEIEEWQANMNVTAFGGLRMIKAVLPAMKAQRAGAIVNITALASVQPAPGQADYAVAKSAVEGATRQLAKELGNYGIRVNATRMGWLWGAPVQGYVKYQAQQSGVPEEQVIASIAQRIALGVVPPDEDCARTALMFVSDYTRMVTGATLDVNGGEYMSS